MARVVDDTASDSSSDVSDEVSDDDNQGSNLQSFFAQAKAMREKNNFPSPAPPAPPPPPAAGPTKRPEPSAAEAVPAKRVATTKKPIDPNWGERKANGVHYYVTFVRSQLLAEIFRVLDRNDTKSSDSMVLTLTFDASDVPNAALTIEWRAADVMFGRLRLYADGFMNYRVPKTFTMCLWSGTLADACAYASPNMSISFYGEWEDLSRMHIWFHTAYGYADGADEKILMLYGKAEGADFMAVQTQAGAITDDKTVRVGMGFDNLREDMTTEVVLNAKHYNKDISMTARTQSDKGRVAISVAKDFVTLLAVDVAGGATQNESKFSVPGGCVSIRWREGKDQSHRPSNMIYDLHEMQWMSKFHCVAPTVTLFLGYKMRNGVKTDLPVLVRFDIAADQNDSSNVTKLPNNMLGFIECTTSAVVLDV